MGRADRSPPLLDFSAHDLRMASKPNRRSVLSIKPSPPSYPADFAHLYHFQFPSYGRRAPGLATAFLSLSGRSLASPPALSQISSQPRNPRIASSHWCSCQSGRTFSIATSFHHRRAAPRHVPPPNSSFVSSSRSIQAPIQMHRFPAWLDREPWQGPHANRNDAYERVDARSNHSYELCSVNST